MEWAANVLIEHIRLVLIRAAYDNYIRIRFRADDVTDPRLYFGKVTSQFLRWRETGGALITWRNNDQEGPHDAILFVECPKSIDAIYRSTRNTSTIGVIFEPPTWLPHEQQIQRRHKYRHPRKCERQMERLGIVREFVARLPIFTRSSLVRLLSRSAASQSSSSLELPEGAEHSADTPD